MKFRAWAIAAIAGLLWLMSGVNAPDALAITQLRVFDIDYHPCPAEIGEGMVAAGSSMDANCFMVTGKAENATNRLVYNADVFGRVYDANNNPVMQNRTRLGAIEEVPPGVTDFEIRISVPVSQPTPLRLEQFKASGFAGQVRR